MAARSSVQTRASLRARSPEETLYYARDVAARRGVSRVVDTTWLDRIGMPVYAAIRPNAHGRSLCVHAGKGLTPLEAEIGAQMEAIEFSFAEPGGSHVEWHAATPVSILNSFGGRIQFPDFCPQIGTIVDEDDPIAAVFADEIAQNLGRVEVPAELVFCPFEADGFVSLYGATTNGLASGNTEDEATAYAIAEVMERDVESFDLVRDRSVLIDLGNTPDEVQRLARKVEDAGLSCFLRYTANAFGLAYFSAYVLEAEEYSPIAVATGSGLHPSSRIAALRALTEAIQSRLSHIHGGRDDIIDRAHHAETIGRQQELDSIRYLRDLARSSGDAIADFRDVPDHPKIADLADFKDCLLAALGRAGLAYVARVTLTAADSPLQVVRVVVPGAECYEHTLRRMGPRLMDFALNA